MSISFVFAWLSSREKFGLNAAVICRRTKMSYVVGRLQISAPRGGLAARLQSLGLSFEVLLFVSFVFRKFARLIWAAGHAHETAHLEVAKEPFHTVSQCFKLSCARYNRVTQVQR